MDGIRFVDVLRELFEDEVLVLQLLSLAASETSQDRCLQDHTRDYASRPCASWRLFGDRAPASILYIAHTSTWYCKGMS